ncbi:AraC family ligand binding domain-containing protein [Pectobacterium cacticida]|uniref:AraC family ligand binding domain-containing protein n=1 Tax=Pectobacterium cacticida TaxID=69221 RepID=A0ABZ2G957_9GAMM|nr:AraC family ligand binding domain-containing protein [Pectobacterium cacticida]UYX08075.1 AraC family ligand binding domain-containing protein [Pectobacterium cacticida]
MEGETQCHYRHTRYTLRVGEMILIDPQQPHSCNPLASVN